MAAIHKKPSYKALPVPNPFQQGQDRAYADILLDKQKEVNIWRKLAFVIIGALIVNFFLFCHSVNQQQAIPLLVNVMPSGESQFLGEVRQGNIQVPEASIHFEIRRFVNNLRSISTDYQVVWNNIDDLFFMATSGYTPIMRQMILANSPFEQIGRIRRTVNVESILNITGHSYQINWTEHEINAYARQSTARFRAVVTIRLIPPTLQTIERNPLGIYIENFEMTELQ